MGFSSTKRPSDGQGICPLRSELHAISHAFSKNVMGPRRCREAILSPQPPDGLIAGGSGIVSTAAINSSRHNSQMADLNFKLPSNKV